MSKKHQTASDVKRIAIISNLSLYGARNFVLGMAEWTRAHANWRFILQEGRPNEQTLDPVALHADAAYVSGSHLAVLPLLRRHHIPFVVGDPLPLGWERLPSLRNVPIVKLDSYAVGALAAEYLFERRYTSFAYVADIDNPSWSVERQTGFVDRLARNGLDCAIYPAVAERKQQMWVHERPRMVEWLKALPKPTAIFAAMDGRARLVLDACSEAEIAVPQEIAVLGVDNDPAICETTYPRLSSIHPLSSDGCGKMTAQTLDALMAGRKLTRLRRTCGSLAVTTRESTGHNAMMHPLMSNALFYIRDRGGIENIRVADVVSRMGCSRRSAEMLFAKQIGRTIREEIERVKFERVQKLLTETKLPISTIAEACGFAGESQLSRRFKALFGQTMSDLRNRQNTFGI